MKVKTRFKRMDIFERAAAYLRPHLDRQLLVSLLLLALLFVAWPQNLSARQDEQDPAQASQGQQYIQQTPEQLQQLVALIALYPDSLVAQILAASTFPEQVVEADQWVQAHPDLKGDALAKAVDQQPWDPSVKALSAFPSVLGNMDKNLSWTSSLGDAYYNQEQGVMDAVQGLRQRAQEAGNLKTTEQQTVTSQDSTIIIEPPNPEVVYVPEYDPWLVYGGPIGPSSLHPLVGLEDLLGKRRRSKDLRHKRIWIQRNRRYQPLQLLGSLLNVLLTLRSLRRVLLVLSGR